MIDQELLNNWFRYEDGKLIRKVTITSRAKKGNVVGTLSTSGYLACSVLGKRVLVHRMIFLMHHGYLPEVVDHIDGNPFNNHIENLRAATAYENMQNQKMHKRNTSGVKGVSWNKAKKQWEAIIGCNGKRERLGWFDSIAEAKVVIEKARTEMHGEFARHA